MSDLRDELQAVYDKHGRLTPELVVEEARPKGHPLHEHVFDCTKAEAAESWRRYRARKLIQSVRCTYATDENGKPKQIRGFVAVQADDPNGDNRGYRFEPTERVADGHDEFALRTVMAALEREMAQAQRRQQEFLDLVALRAASGREAA